MGLAPGSRRESETFARTFPAKNHLQLSNRKHFQDTGVAAELSHTHLNIAKFIVTGVVPQVPLNGEVYSLRTGKGQNFGEKRAIAIKIHCLVFFDNIS